MVVEALTRLRLPTGLDEWLEGDRGAAVERALVVDKKRSAGTVSYVALARVGEPSVVSLSLRDLLNLLRQRTTPAE
jgi:3-dehydroquinate synthetase